MSSPKHQTYKLIVSVDGRRTVGPPLDFERAAQSLVAHYEEGILDAELWVGLRGKRRANPIEQRALVGRAAEIATES